MGSFLDEGRCIEEKIYDVNRKKQREMEQEIEAYKNYYRTMGFNAYMEHEKKYFLENMKKFEEEGYRIESVDLSPDEYYGEEDREWSITARLRLYHGNQLCERIYRHTDREDEVRRDINIDCSSGGILIYSGWCDMNRDEEFERAVNYMGIAEDVDNYYGY